MGIKNTTVIAFALIATANVAHAGTGTCDGRWSTAGYWPSAAYAVVNTQLLYHLTAANYTLVDLGSATALQTQPGTLTFEGGWSGQYAYLEGVFSIRYDITVYSGLDHVPRSEAELFFWPPGSTHRFGYNGTMFTCVAPPPPVDYVFTTPGFHTFSPPPGCTTMDVKLWGAGGGGHPDSNRGAWGGGAGFTSATITVPLGRNLYIGVGQAGTYYDDSYITGGGPTTILLPTNTSFDVLAQAGGGGAGGVYLGAAGGVGGGETSGFGGNGGSGDGGGVNNSEGHGGRNWDGTFNGGYELFTYSSNTPAGGGYWQGGLGFDNTRSAPGGGGSGWVHGPGVTSHELGQGTFRGIMYIPGGLNDYDGDGYSGFGGLGSGTNGRVFIHCR